MKIGFVCHAYNEVPLVRRLLSSAATLGRFHEFVLVDHRSEDADGFAAVADEFGPRLQGQGIRFVFAREERDFSPDFTMADLKNTALGMSEADIVAFHDADFVLGPGYTATMRWMADILSNESLCCVGYRIPVVYGHLSVQHGRVTSHGPCYRHPATPRAVARGRGLWRQDHVDGHHEWFRREDGTCPMAEVPYAKGSVVSIDIKPLQRRLLRSTMTDYLARAVGGSAAGTWLEDYEAGRLEANDDSSKRNNVDGLPDDHFDMTGHRLYMPDGDIGHE